ncbi:MAG: hypothetical protein ACXVDF_18645 [Ktedonobacterales bacterium]
MPTHRGEPAMSGRQMLTSHLSGQHTVIRAILARYSRQVAEDRFYPNK